MPGSFRFTSSGDYDPANSEDMFFAGSPLSTEVVIGLFTIIGPDFSRGIFAAFFGQSGTYLTDQNGSTLSFSGGLLVQFPEQTASMGIGGGLFADVITTGSGADHVFGYGGNDIIDGGAGSDRLYGCEGDDTIFGGDGNDILVGGPGNDTLVGGLGNDFYFLEDGADTVSDAGGVRDLIVSTISRSLGAYRGIEGLYLAGSAAVNGSGDGRDNVLSGNVAANTLTGLAGNDTVIGGAGRDTSTGGHGNDVFRFASASESPRGSGADIITDFDDFGNDRIDLRQVYGATLEYIHNAAFTAAGQVRVNDVAGTSVVVEVNTAGSLAADMQIRLAGTMLASMTASDFIL